MVLVLTAVTCDGAAQECDERPRVLERDIVTHVVVIAAGIVGLPATRVVWRSKKVELGRRGDDQLIQLRAYAQKHRRRRRQTVGAKALR